MFQLKTLSQEAIPRSLEKAERYRLLNEPAEAESICLDILQIDPDNQQALITLLLALTDQFDKLNAAVHEAEELLPRLRSDYERAYYAGIICERRGKARLHHAGPGAVSAAYSCFRQAMEWYEKAEGICPPGNDDATLRWNTCARLIMRDPHLRPAVDEWIEHQLE
jgi:tetratricopeptide (TPR) repeat protein